jgi:hypothetical protein
MAAYQIFSFFIHGKGFNPQKVVIAEFQIAQSAISCKVRWP